MALDSLQMDLTVVLGKTRLPLHRLLRMGRGAVIGLDPAEDDRVEILANGLAVAEGRVIVTGGTISVEILSLARPIEVTRDPGATIGGLRPGSAATIEPSPVAA